MNGMYDQIVDFFTRDEWPFQPMEGRPILRMGFRGKSGTWTCYAQVREEQSLFLFYSVSPINVPAEKIASISEYITRANYGLLVGNFELDYHDGEVRYKTSVDVEGTALSYELIYNLVYANVSTMDRYLPGILSVLYGSVSPEEAVRQVESGSADSSPTSN